MKADVIFCIKLCLKSKHILEDYFGHMTSPSPPLTRGKKHLGLLTRLTTPPLPHPPRDSEHPTQRALSCLECKFYLLNYVTGSMCIYRMDISMQITLHKPDGPTLSSTSSDPMTWGRIQGLLRWSGSGERHNQGFIPKFTWGR